MPGSHKYKTSDGSLTTPGFYNQNQNFTLLKIISNLIKNIAQRFAI